MRRKYDINLLHSCKYPNLMAEFMETGYSICTLSVHMGHGNCSEDNAMIWNKLSGKEEITVKESIGLLRLFGCDANYLLSKKLEMQDGKPVAYHRHYESNKRQEEDLRVHRILMDVQRTMREKPYLVDFIKSVLSWTEEQVNQVAAMVHQLDIT